MNKRKNFLVVFSFLVVLVGTMVFSGCETSRVAPETPRPNPAPPAPQAVVLSGYVLDGGTGNGISGASVNLTKLDGTVVSTATTNASGLYSFNLTALNVADATLNVNTNVTGYGYGFRIASYDKANGATAVTPIVLTKIANVTTVTIGTSGGAATVPPSTDAKTSAPVTVTVPANAVPANTQVTVATVPVVSTPPPSLPATQNIVSSNNLAAPGVTTFAQPVTMTFNLPFGLPVGTQIPLLLLNTTTNKWENTGLNAVVAAGGVTASVQVTKPGQYALLGNVSVSQTVTGKMVAGDNSISVTKTQKISDTADDFTLELTPTTKTLTYTGDNDPAPFITDISGTDFPNQSFTYGLIQQRFGVNIHTTAFSNFIYILTYNLPSTLKGSDGVAFPTSQNNVIIGPPGHTSESGDWINRWTFTRTLVTDIYNVTQTGIFSRNVSRPRYKYSVSSEWVWRAHNQGGSGLGGYNP